MTYSFNIDPTPFRSFRLEQAGIEPTVPMCSHWVGVHTPLLRITAGLPLPAGRLSELSCVTDFRIATVFTLRRSPSFRAV